MTTLIYKIPPTLPLPKGGFSPLFSKEGCAENFWTNVNSIMRPLINALHDQQFEVLISSRNVIGGKMVICLFLRGLRIFIDAQSDADYRKDYFISATS